MDLVESKRRSSLKERRLRAVSARRHNGPVDGLATALAALVVGMLGTFALSAAAGTSPKPPLTKRVPEFVTQVCDHARRDSPLRLVCPPLVPVSRYVKVDGLYGALLGSQGLPRVRGAARFLYLVSFNAGDNGPEFVHWVAGMGSEEAIQYWVLSDARNVVRGRPKLVRELRRDGRDVDVWRFPAYPAGGQFGGHIVAIARSRTRFALASIHGYDTVEACVRMAIALARKADATRR
jgi:hypothetical protein